MSSNIFATPSVTRPGIEVFEYHDFSKRVAIDKILHLIQPLYMVREY
ncbi:hypothetical protein BMETH_1591_0 [methanotrophic bacterial endosymbiont of Bathymodiolus sp.]|jgi:hypothetical protein|nr:hypothetical protein BMETH_1591_0 [methanotrophic bacterial endosymbiont of Bathymodiolus sp.]